MLEDKIKHILKENGLLPIKYRGQNFLVDKEILEEIVSFANLKKDEKVLEIGPGIGNLTTEILAKNVDVTAVEKDENLAKILKNHVKNERLAIINKSILEFNEATIKSPYKVIANIPYYLTGPILRKFLFGKNRPSLLVLTIQKEVGERLIAKAPKSNFLAQIVSLVASVEIKKIIKPESFWPKPKVNSVIVLIKPKKTIPQKELNSLLKFIRSGFKQPRKTLLNNLLASHPKKEVEIKKALEELELKNNIRAHELTQEEWQDLFKNLN